MSKPTLVMTDSQLLDALQEATTGYGKGWIFRESYNGRGMRLHETILDGAVPDVREAIFNFVKEKNT